jgi:glycosyltransferase involved in cell wall biosynthesis
VSDRFVFLFVGSINYYPNLDAVVFFCREVAPVLRRQTAARFEIRVVAWGRQRQWSRVPQLPELVRCEQSDHGLAAEYARADAVVVPIRAGGGTRIKILEAFAHQKPVVATSIGAEGLDVRNDEHILIADTPEAFAAQCLRLMQDSGLRSAVADHAFELVTARYGTEALQRCIDRVEGL